MVSSHKPIALVTGARRGIGKFLANHLLSANFTVVGASRNPSEWGAPDYLDVPTDVSDEKAVRQLMKQIRKLKEDLKVVINNAGVASMNAALLTPGSSVKQMMEINVLGTFLVSREAAKLMQRQSQGHIINLSSVAVSLNLEGEAAYAASKAAVESLTKTMATEVKDYGISVNALSLPPLDIGMTKGVPKKTLESLIQRLPIKRMGTLEEITRAVDVLIQQENTHTTGQIISLVGFPTK